MSEALARRDAEARRLAQTRFDLPLLLEAGAGTGKTAVLVARVVAWSLGPGWERSARRLRERRGSAPAPEAVAAETLRRVVAITFTEAAAAEMGTRVAAALLQVRRGELPLGVAEEALPDRALRPARAEALVGSLDQLATRTIHAFCRRLLVAHPLDAGLHPDLEVDADGQIQAEVAREVLEARLPSAFGDVPDPDFATLVDAGLGPGHLEQALVRLLADGALAEDLEDDPLAPTRVAPFGTALGAALEAFVRVERGRLSGLGRRAPRVAATAEAVEAVADAAAARPPVDRDALEAFLALLRDHVERPRLDDLRGWSRGGLGANASKALGSDAQALAGAAAALHPLLDHACRLDLPRLDAGRRVLAELLADARARLRARGVESFGGLLRHARDLLQQQPEVAAREAARMDQLLVDEFQDTDAVQCGLLEALALRPPPAARPTLFLVGDPKQSIYAWRSADLRAYHAFRRRLEAGGGRVLPLAVNYRSAPAVLDEVARVVAPVMREAEGLQPAFERLLPSEATWELPGHRGAGRAPVEHWLCLPADENGVLDEKPSARSAGELEARAVARDLRRLHDDGVPWEDVGLLFRSTGDFELYLGALREAGIPFAVERETAHYERREVVDATALVRCVLDPNDHLALVATLRAACVGVPDAALLPLWREGLHERLAAVDGHDAEALAAARAAGRRAAAQTVAAGIPGLAGLAGWEAALDAFLVALAELRRLHAERPAPDFVEGLRALLLPEASEAARYLGGFRVANLDRFFRDLLEALEDGAGSAAAVAARLRRAGSLEREHQEGRPRALSGDAVHVMTIHRAKGLDFGHVYLLQTHKQGGRDRGPRTSLLRGGGRPEYVLFDAPTPGAFEAEQAAAAVEAAERVRLLYVALTRAKHRLVVSGGKPPWQGAAEAAAATHADLLARRTGTPTDLAARLREAAARRAPAWVDDAGVSWRLPAFEPAPPAAPAGARPEAVAPTPEQVRADAERLREARAGARCREMRPYGRAASDEEGHEEAAPGARLTRPGGASRETALAAGTAVHAALESVDLAGPDAAWRDALAAALADAAPEVAAHAGALLDACLAGPLAARLRRLAPHVVARELPVLLAPDEAPEAGEEEPVGFWSGAVDLLYRDPESDELVVADYKSDPVPEAGLPERAAAYAGQGRIYVRAVRRALGLARDPRFELWFLHPGQVLSPLDGA